jgi:hypothetical protein
MKRVSLMQGEIIPGVTTREGFYLGDFAGKSYIHPLKRVIQQTRSKTVSIACLKFKPALSGSWSSADAGRVLVAESEQVKNHLMRKREVNRLLLEGGLIVFSVLFALFIDRLAEEYKTSKQKKIALARIHQELAANKALVRLVLVRHKRVVSNLTRASSNPLDSLRAELAKKAYLDFSLLSEGKSIYPRLPSSVSWEAARSTGIVAEFDYQIVEACTDVYSSQETIARVTLPKIIDNLFEAGNGSLDNKLIELQLGFEELIAQEQTLLERVELALKKTKP